MKIKRLFAYLGIMVIFINLPLWDFFTQDQYTYSNYDGSFQYTEYSGTRLPQCERSYGYFLCKHPDKAATDSQLYRTFQIRPWRFWQWRELLLHSEKFALPYLSNGISERE